MKMPMGSFQITPTTGVFKAGVAQTIVLLRVWTQDFAQAVLVGRY